MALSFNDFGPPEGFSQKGPTGIEVRSPKRDEDVTVHKDWRSPVVTLVLIGSKHHLVAKALCPLLQKHIFTCQLQAVATSNAFFIWPLKTVLPAAANAADKAKKKGCCRVAWDAVKREYDIVDASAKQPDPVWPEAGFESALVEPAFEGRILNDPDDPRVKDLLEGD